MEEESKLEVVLDIEMASDLDDPWCLTSPAMPAPFDGHGNATPQANQRCCQWQTKARRNLRKIKQISINDKANKPTQYALLNDILEKSPMGSAGPPKPEGRPKSGPACKRKAKRKHKLTSANLPRKKKRKKTGIDIDEMREYFGYTVDASGGDGVKNSDPCAIHDVVSHSTGDDAVCVSDDEETGDITTLQTDSLLDSKHNSVIENLDVRTVAFPTRDDPDAVEVHVSDLNYLQDLVYLNDTVIDFHIKYIQVSNIEPERKQMFHFYNSFFFKQLVEFVCAPSSLVHENKIVKLRKWTKGIDIFQKSYLILPVHHGFHWSLAIICFTEASIGHESVPTCYILHLDSMQNGHKTNYICEVIRRYLIAEWDSRNQAGDVFHKIATDNVNALGEKEKNTPTVSTKRIMVPRQENEFDCGLFLLHFIELFVKEAPSRLNPDSMKHMFGKQWFKPLEASSLRILIRQHIERLLQGNER